MIPTPLFLALSVAAAPATAPPEENAPVHTEEVYPFEAGQPDVVLHVPRAEVGKLALDVENLEARLDVNTKVAGLVEIQAGVVANVGKLKLQVEEVSAETRLVVRLDRVARIMERALGTIDEHPDLAAAPAAPRAPRSVPAAEPVPARAQTGAPATPPSPEPSQE